MLDKGNPPMRRDKGFLRMCKFTRDRLLKIVGVKLSWEDSMHALGVCAFARPALAISKVVQIRIAKRLTRYRL
jgi:hypothetical protein